MNEQHTTSTAPRCIVCHGVIKTPSEDTEFNGKTITIHRSWCAPGEGPIHKVCVTSANGGRTNVLELDCYDAHLHDMSMKMNREARENDERRRALQPAQDTDSRRAKRIFG